MSIKIEKTDNKNEIKLEFTIDSKVFIEGIEKVYKKNAKYITVPGFRKGKVPMNIAEKHYGVEIFYEDAFNEIVPAIYEKEMEILKVQAMNEGKPAEIAEKMVQGRIGKYYSEICLLDQEFVKDPNVKVGELIKYKGANIVEFARLEKGEGLEKREENFAEEVMKQIK